MQYKVFGCKVNKYYTDRWLNSEYLADKTGTFVASCVVTDSAKRKWVRFVKKELQNLTGTQKIYISGCGAFKDGKAQSNFFDLYPELAHAQDKIEVLDEEPQNTTPTPPQSGILSPLEEKGAAKLESVALLSSKGEEIQRGGSSGKWDTANLSKLQNAQKNQIYTKKFILIQGGCDSFCTFCLTVVKRGRHYYRSPEDIAEEIRDFEEQGGKEVVLTGVNLSAWGLDNTHDIETFSSDVIKNGRYGGNKSRFAELLKYLLENTSIPRLRISSLGPEFITDEVVEIFSDERIYPHFHFSIQSGSSQVLKSMARHYDGNFMRKLLTKIRNIQRNDGVDVSIGADIIVGFPGESEQDFMDTYNLVKDYAITKVHAFPFSAHTMGESVPAGKFKEQISDSIKKDRMNRLMKLGDEIREEFRASQKGMTLKVLIEKVKLPSLGEGLGESIWSGWSENYLEADENNFKIISGEIKKNSIVVGKFK